MNMQLLDAIRRHDSLLLKATQATIYDAPQRLAELEEAQEELVLAIEATAYDKARDFDYDKADE